MAKLTGGENFDAVLTGVEMLPINLETLTGTSTVSETQSTFLVRVEATVNWSLSTTWVANFGHGILNAVVKGNQLYPTPYYAILNQGSITNTNPTTALGSDTSTEAHNVIFLWRGGSVTNASGALLDQRSADDYVGAIHFEKGPTSPNELYNDGTIKSGLVAVYNKGQFRLENTGTIEGNVYSTDGTVPVGQTSYLVNSSTGTITGKHEAGASPIVKQAAVYLQDANVDIENHGRIEASGSYGIYTPGNSRFKLDNSGTIEAGTYAVYLLGGGEIDNSGTITSKTGIAFGFGGSPAENSISITNSGTIKGTTTDAILGSRLDTVEIVNDATGQIVSEGTWLTNAGISLRGLSGRSQEAKIENAGLIEGTIGVTLQKTSGATAQNLTIENSGTISARVSTGTAISSQADTKVTLEMKAGGLLTGGISTLGAADVLKVTGTSKIDGSVAGMETISIVAGTATITGTLTGFVTATVGSGATLAVDGAITGPAITLAGGRLELSGTTASTITTFSADAHAELHFKTLSATSALSVTTATIDGVKLSIGSATEAELTVLAIDGDTTLASGTFEGLAEGASLSIGSSTYAISYVGGDGNDIVLTRTSTGGGGGGEGNPTIPSVVDGVTIRTKTVTNSDGTTSTQVAIPIVSATRQDSTGNSDVADIPLVKSGGTNLLTVQVPVGFGLTATGTATPKTSGSSLTDLIREIKAHTPDGSEDQTALAGGGTSFLSGFADTKPLIVQTIVPVIAGNTPPDQPLVIKGQPQIAGGPLVALVIDGSALPPGTILELQDVHFAAVIGPVTVQGGAGSQMVWGDSSAQTIILGEDDDVLHGGGGDDIIGSAGGNDQIFGNAGNDTLFGGSGADQLHGGTGSDVVTYEGAASGYTISQNHAVITVQSLDDPNDIDTLINVEAIKFGDQLIKLDYTPTLDIIAGLYQQLFARQADLGGVQYWAEEMAKGGSAGEIVMKFFDSPESREQGFGGFGPSGEITLELLYEVIFDRKSDDGGMAYWQTARDNGMSLTEIANHFAFSAEMQQNHVIAPTGWEFQV